MKHIVRIGPAWLRLPLLCIWLPIAWLAHGASFSGLPVAIFWAAWDGRFVP